MTILSFWLDELLSVYPFWLPSILGCLDVVLVNGSLSTATLRLHCVFVAEFRVLKLLGQLNRHNLVYFELKLRRVQADKSIELKRIKLNPPAIWSSRFQLVCFDFGFNEFNDLCKLIAADRFRLEHGPSLQSGNFLLAFQKRRCSSRLCNHQSRLADSKLLNPNYSTENLSNWILKLSSLRGAAVFV